MSSLNYKYSLLDSIRHEKIFDTRLHHHHFPPFADKLLAIVADMWRWTRLTNALKCILQNTVASELTVYSEQFVCVWFADNVKKSIERQHVCNVSYTNRLTLPCKPCSVNSLYSLRLISLFSQKFSKISQIFKNIYFVDLPSFKKFRKKKCCSE